MNLGNGIKLTDIAERQMKDYLAAHPDMKVEIGPESGTFDLRRAQLVYVRVARNLINKITDNVSEERALLLERAYDSLMDAHDWLEDMCAIIGPRGNLRDADESDVQLPSGNSCSAAVDYGWRDKEGRAVPVLSPDQSVADHLARSGGGASTAGVGFGDFLRAAAIGARSDAETRVLNEGTPSAGGYTVPAPLAAAFIDRLRAQSVVFRAGARTVPMTANTLKIARLDTDPAFAFRAENDEITAGTDPTFSPVTFTAKSCVCLVKASRELLEDSVNVNEALLGAFSAAGALVVDRVALRGDSNNDEPEGILNITGINELTGIGSPTYDDWIDAIYELEVVNVPGAYAAIAHPRTLRTLRKLKADGAYLMPPPEVATLQRLTSTQLAPDDLGASPPETSASIVGHFPHLMIGMRAELRVEVLRERYADYYQYGFLGHIRFDVQLAHKASFCALRGITE